MVLKLIKEASMYGWHVVTSADVSAKVTKTKKYRNDLTSWVCKW